MSTQLPPSNTTDTTTDTYNNTGPYDWQNLTLLIDEIIPLSHQRMVDQQVANNLRAICPGCKDPDSMGRTIAHKTAEGKIGILVWNWRKNGADMQGLLQQIANGKWSLVYDQYNEHRNILTVEQAIAKAKSAQALITPP